MKKLICVALLVTGCGPQSQVNPNCKPAPVADAGPAALIITEDKPQLKLPMSVQLGAPAIDGTTYAWTPVDGLSDPAAAQPIAQPSKSTMYTLKATNACGWTTATVQVDVYSE